MRNEPVFRKCLQSFLFFSFYQVSSQIISISINFNLNCSAISVTGIVIAVGQPVLYPKETPIPESIELSGNTTESYWKDFQLLGLYNLEGYQNGAPYYKRDRSAIVLGEIYFYYSINGSWIVTNENEFQDNTGRGWLMKKSPGEHAYGMLHTMDRNCRVVSKISSS